MTLIEWATRWAIPPQALEEFCRSALYVVPAADDNSEARVQSEIRLAAARSGKMYLFRNNVGAGKLSSGSFVRFGLGNDSAAVNDAFKSADLIGWQRVPITQAMVGTHLAQFLSVEVKRRNWKFAGTVEECAQAAWAALVNAQGGRAVITNTDGSLDPGVS